MHVRTISVTTNWVSLPDLRGVRVDFLNRTGAALQIRYARETGVDQLITIPDGAPAALRTLANASEIQIKAVAGATGVNLVISPS
jgi:hypothetical protein